MSWDDGHDQDGLRPERVILRVKGAGESEAVVVVTAGTDSKWSWELRDLPKRKKCREIAYVVREDAIQNYMTTVTGSTADGYTVTNKLTDHSYAFTKGDGSGWKRGSDATLDFTVKRSRNDSASFRRFTGIRIDGKEVPKTAYDASAGSVILVLKPSYLEKLDEGSHFDPI